MRRILIVVVVACGLAACSSSKATSSPPSTSAATTRPGTAPRFDVVLDDNGLTFPPGKTLAAKYLVSFEDRRTAPPADQKLHLQFIVSGPQLVLVDVPAGTASTHVLLANMTPDLVYVDPGFAATDPALMRPDGRAHRHSISHVRVTNPPEIETTPEYPTPVT